ncbi:hypothetical protein AAKU55_005751 [Oxalobacteraceae bacterium GrIS 1.11]
MNTALVLTALDCFRATLTLVGIGMVLSSLEFMSLHKHFLSGGLYSWEALKMRRQLETDRPISALAAVLFEREAFLLVLATRLGAALSIVAYGAIGIIHLPSIAVALTTQLLFSYRNSIGGDGSDQMTSVVLVATFLYALNPGNPISREACLWFLALQSCLAYTASGAAKLYSKKWRAGTALFEILNTRTYGTRVAASFFKVRPSLSKWLSYSVMACQLSFVLALLLPWPWNAVYLIWGLSFHCGIALLMGLNLFPFPFSACYPAVIYCSFRIQGLPVG